jgi:hypothetical protein
MQNLLNNIIQDPKSEIYNFNLGWYYEQQGHTASALSFYLKAAEYGVNRDIVYESLIRMSKCLSKQGRRPATEKSLIHNAISYEPTRPEAYLIYSQYAEYHKDWHGAYTMSNIGLQFINNAKPTITDIGYLGEYVLIFQKALSGFQKGLSRESRLLFYKLIDDYSNVMNEFYTAVTSNNIINIGAMVTFNNKYTESKYFDLRFKFAEADKIKTNYAQTYQDMFTLSMHNGKRNGTYLEIGSNDPFFNSNTALLETQFDWTGVSIDIKQPEVDKFNAQRKNQAIAVDATQINYTDLIAKHFTSIDDKYEIDYLQIDCEPAETTYKILTMIPFETCKFGVITYEHDHRCDVSRTCREKSRKFLTAKGYKLIVNDIAPDDAHSYEDWWVHPDLIDTSIISKMECVNDQIKNAEKYMLNKL